MKFENGWVDNAQTRERITSVNQTWTLKKIASSKAMGIKLMLYYRPDASTDTIRRQKQLVHDIGKECRELDIIFCLEPMWYPMLDDEIEPGNNTSRILAERRPKFVIESLRDFALPEYGVDLFKLEFPADLNFVKEYVGLESSDQKLPPLYDLAAVKKLCMEIGKIADAPWTIMSSGVSNTTFIEYIHLCRDGDVNGYICGQAIWKNALRSYPDFEAIAVNLKKEAIPNIHKINIALNDR